PAIAAGRQQRSLAGERGRAHHHRATRAAATAGVITAHVRVLRRRLARAGDRSIDLRRLGQQDDGRSAGAAAAAGVVATGAVAAGAAAAAKVVVAAVVGPRRGTAGAVAVRDGGLAALVAGRGPVRGPLARAAVAAVAAAGTALPDGAAGPAAAAAA